MPKKTLLLLAICSFVVGCAAKGPGIVKPQTTCSTINIPSACNGNPNDPKVNINRNSLNFSPPNVCAKKGTTIEFTLTPNSANVEGNAAIVPKKATDTWLNGTNSPNKDKIFIKIPTWVTAGDHDYGLILSNGDCVDPRVDVT